MTKYLTLLLLLLSVGSANAAKLTHWPHQKWTKKDPAQAGFSYLKLHALEKFVFAKDKGYSSNSLLIIKDGNLVYEKYDNGYTYQKPHRLWSISKSITNAIAGVALLDGTINLKDLIASTYPKLRDDDKKRKIKVMDLLRMSSGLEWNEGYESNIFTSDIIKTLYGSEQADAANYVSSRPSHCMPGYCYQYSSGDTNLLMGHLKNKLGQKKYDEYPFKNFFSKIGIHTATWEQDRSGTFIGSSYLFMTPRDLAKVGLLYLNGGRTDKETIVPGRYINWSLQVTPAFNKAKLDGIANAESYGAGWWLNRELPEKSLKRPYPAAPESAYFGLGHHGQILAIIPNHNIVIVRHGADKDGKFDLNKMIALTIEAMTQDTVQK